MTPTATKNRGTMIAINTKDPIMLADDNENTRNESDVVLSTVSMSLENPFIIQPGGAVSKKLTGAYTMEVIVLWWRDFDAKYAKGPTTIPVIKNMMTRETAKAA